MRLRLQLAAVDQAPEISALRLAVAAHLSARFGPGPWSHSSTVKGVLYDLRHSVLYVVIRRRQIIATLALCQRKPWSIAPAYFTKCRQPLYLVSLAVAPVVQGMGVGRACLAAAVKIAAASPADFIRLDAYAAPAGAGDFYRRCGFTEVGRASYRGVPLVYFELELRRPEPADLAR
jgi:ribosomal protein S18 acetylase RimI-like enzyme